MSYTEFHTGKLKKVDLGELSLLEFCEAKCKEAGVNEICSYNDDWIEQFRDTLWYGNKEKYFIHGEDVYELIEHEEMEDDGYFMKMKENPDGTISFISQFYNGGTC